MLGGMRRCLLQERVFGCSGLMAQGMWVPHSSEVAFTTACYYGIAVIAHSCLTCQHLKLYTGSTFLQANCSSFGLIFIF